MTQVRDQVTPQMIHCQHTAGALLILGAKKILQGISLSPLGNGGTKKFCQGFPCPPWVVVAQKAWKWDTQVTP